MPSFPSVLRPLLLCAGLMLGFGERTATAQDAADRTIQLRVVGGLAGISQYTRHEEPFWTQRVPRLTRGAARASIAPFDRSGIRGSELLQLMRLGVVPFGNVILSVAAAEEPELNGIDLPGASPDLPALARMVAAWRPRIAELLRDRYGIELLAIYTYPAQVVFCGRPFGGLADLAGRRVRTSSAGQSELISALGGTPVVIPFMNTVDAVRAGTVECAITAALSGNAVGLAEVTTHISPTAISWGVSVFGANQAAWDVLPAPIRDALRDGLVELEAEIWQAAAREVEDGLLCNAGRPGCSGGRPGRMIVIAAPPEEAELRRRLLREAVLPGWVARCGAECADTWNWLIAPPLGLPATRP